MLSFTLDVIFPLEIEKLKTAFANFIMKNPRRLAMPIGVYAGLDMTGATVLDAISNPQAQADAQLALHNHFHSPVLLTAMDLSAEAETFGCQIRFTKDEIPTVIGRRVTTLSDINSLPSPEPGDKRTQVNLDAARLLTKFSAGVPVLGGLIGPFSLAGRIFGVSEALEQTMTEPEVIHELLERTTRFLISYGRAHRASSSQSAGRQRLIRSTWAVKSRFMTRSKVSLVVSRNVARCDMPAFRIRTSIGPRRLGATAHASARASGFSRSKQSTAPASAPRSRHSWDTSSKTSRRLPDKTIRAP